MNLRGRFAAAAAALAVAAGGLVAGASGASAAACTASQTTHCYTTIIAPTFSPDATQLKATMHWRCMTEGSGPSGVGWMTHSLWGGDQDGGTTEMGFINPPSGNVNIPVNYWVRYGGSYGTGLQLFYTTATMNRNQNYAMKMQWNGSYWVLTRDGTTIGQLSSPTGPLNGGQAGFEDAVTNTNNDSGDVNTIQRVQNGVTYSGFGTGSSDFNDSPPWKSPPNVLNFQTAEVDDNTTGSGVVGCA